MPIDKKATIELIDHLVSYILLYLSDYFHKYDFLGVVKDDLERIQELLVRLED